MTPSYAALVCLAAAKVPRCRGVVQHGMVSCAVPVNGLQLSLTCHDLALYWHLPEPFTT